MNLEKLKQAEERFLIKYPEGFNHPDMIVLGKKHKMSQMIDLTQESFKSGSFDLPNKIVDDMVKIVSRASMVSMFEKPKFRDFAKALTILEKELFVDGFQERLHGNEQQGFEMMIDALKTRKLAKWSLISICPLYFRPTFDVFVKPTTAKGIISALELDDLHYKPTPSWEFYEIFRNYINEMKTKVDSSLSPNNAAFTGFLMMTF